MTTLDIFDLVYDFNDKAGLIKAGYDDFRESAFQVEEAIEGLDLYELALFLHGPEYTGEVTSKALSRSIIAPCYIKQPVPDIDRLDKACDAIIFAIGSMAKLGLSPEQMRQALDIVAKANLAKLSMPKDEHGKLTKPADWEQYAPEVQLQALLNQQR